MSKVLVIGASGLVGSYLYKLISKQCNTTGTYEKFSLKDLIRLNVTDYVSVEKIINDVHPEYVFLPAALTNVDLCEDNKKLCFKINVEAVSNIANILRNKKIKLIYFSTDFIFDGKAGPYSEEDKPAPLGIYGLSKLEAEKIIRSMLSDYLVIRTTCIYGWEPQEKNFVINLIKKNRTGISVEVPLDQITTPTYAGNLAEITWKLVQGGKRGIYNVVGATLISRLDFAFLIARIFGLNKELITSVKTEYLKRKAKRPLNGGLKIEKTEKELSIKVPSTEESLLEMKKEDKYG